MIKHKFNQTLSLLKRYYPDAHCALDHKNPFELLIATILSAQCTDERVNQVTPALFKKFPDPQSMSQASLTELEGLIRSAGFFKTKAKSLKGTATIIVTKHKGKVPKKLEDLTEMPGVGRKTANVVLGNSFQIASGVVVDTHVSRLSKRLGFTKQTTPEKIEKDLIKLCPEEDWIMLSHYLISHGRTQCKARTAFCSTCFLEEICPKKGVTSRV